MDEVLLRALAARRRRPLNPHQHDKPCSIASADPATGRYGRSLASTSISGRSSRLPTIAPNGRNRSILADPTLPGEGRLSIQLGRCARLLAKSLKGHNPSLPVTEPSARKRVGPRQTP
jgi:hypothetical protein